MRKFVRNLVVAAGLGLSMLAATNLAIAQVIPSTSTTQRRPVPRVFPTQQVHYIRTTLTFGMCVQVANTCTVQIANAALPYNAAVLRVTAIVHTAFNSTTSDVIIVGTTTAANQIVSANVSLAAQGLVAGTVIAGASSATGVTATQTGQNGGFDIFVKWTAGTGNTATTGLASLVIEYVAPNDANCTVVAQGATAAGC